MKTFSKILLAFVAITTLALANNESTLLSELKSAKTPEAKDTVIRSLTPIASAKSIDALSEYAMDPYLGQLAINALRSIPDKKATDALIKVANQSDPKLREMAAQALGKRGDPAAIPTLEKLSNESDPLLAEAAINALSKIGTPEALASLYKLSVAESLQSVLAQARATATQKQLSLAGNYEPALSAQALDEKLSASARMASLRTLLLAKAPSAATTFATLLASKSADIRILAASYANLMNNPAQASAAIGSTDAATAVVAINALAENPAKDTASALLPLLNSKEVSIRIATIRALGPVGDIESARALLPLLLKFDSPESAAANQALRKIQGKETTEFLRDTFLMTKDVPEKTALISILSDRLDRSILPMVMENANTDDPALRIAVFQAVGNLAEPTDIQKIIDLLPEVKSADTRRIWESALLLAAQNTTQEHAAEVVGLLSKAIPNADAQTRPSLLKAIASIDAPQAADQLRAMLKDPDANVRKTNIRALSNIRTPLSLEILIESAESAKDLSEKVLALRGYIDGLSSLKDTPLDTLAEYYYKAYKIAPRDEEKEACISQIKILSKRSRQARIILRELKIPIPAK